MPADPSPSRPDLPSALRFLTELIAWVATPWALAAHSVALAVASVVVLIGLPTLFATPGDKKQVILPVPAVATIALVLLQLVAAAASSWAAWPPPVAVAVTALALVTLVTELPRWRRLAPLGRDGRPARRVA
ncbi:hypothetical protein Q2K19_24430 [Micromonospora soli]|uniref:hypothetical protein n=1 Tax=Micromonospora sp. NBRC 110009 TaxID=3061627 RepID=UPI002670D351|nr:hypothetical protein [Micromonospora sp. NBRC 110009]WKT97297.1 hypothetical protein Q2K19_24430 [Micromonospora sp. NBRC 110009]